MLRKKHGHLKIWDMVSANCNLEGCKLFSVISEIIGTQLLFSLLKLILQCTATNLSCSPNNISNSSGQNSNSVLSRSYGRFVWEGTRTAALQGEGLCCKGAGGNLYWVHRTSWEVTEKVERCRNHITMSSGYKLKPSWQDEQIQLDCRHTSLSRSAWSSLICLFS